MTTQNCAECDSRVEPGQSFCDACGAVLSWDRSGARSAAPTASGPGSAPGPASAPASGSASGYGSGPGSGDASGWDASAHPGGAAPAPTTAPYAADAHTPRPAPGPPQGAPAHGAPGHGTAGRAPFGAAPGAAPGGPPYPSGNPDLTDTTPNTPAAAAPDALSDRARSLLVPVSEPEARPAGPPPSVAPVLPGRPDTERPRVRAPGPHRGTGHGASCPWCATPNHPERHFCARCAMPLAERVGRGDGPPAHRPWWRRIFGPDRNETPWAGDRPRLRRVFDRVGTWVTAAVVLPLLVFGAVNVPDGVQATRDHFAKRAPVEPDGIRASRSYEGHGPKLAFDKLNNTWWGPGVAQSGQGEWIEVSFARPTRLLDVIITPGMSIRADQLGKSALPHRVKATITKKDGSTATRELTLDPGAGGQRRAFRVGEVTRVRFTIESAHAASDKKQVAIAEIELFGRSGSDRS
ncbi:discoidin domain-containing protein [Streptomyces sp. AN091965]|uniref:discoidin domain-containing protein n=1 Tax=Streptomyces sp. AN091965 TaxID=2927803 RepID=UPI001F60AC8A|nr:discoidin domain-containing protein [Streptomyces sp. AN091965]MCI3928237.1 discoidin domain-containing protein [Streptomyces sp. AN091965]